MKAEKYALITGASTGIGRYLALECAKNGYHLVLTALPGTGIELVARNLRFRFDCDVHAVEADLSTPHGPEQILSYCLTHQLQISVLVNNAGIGGESEFRSMSLMHCNTLLQLNTVAVVKLTRLFLPVLEQQQSYILNVSSLASFIPMPFKCIYAASKTFIRHFSLLLRAELKHSSVSVTALCPGAVPTNDLQRSTIRKHGLMAVLSSIEPDELARIAIRGMLDQKAIVIPGYANRFSRFLMYILPEWLQLSLLYDSYKSKLIT